MPTPTTDNELGSDQPTLLRNKTGLSLAMKPVHFYLGTLRRAIRYSLWSFLYTASEKRTYGYRFLLANYGRIAYARIGARFRKRDTEQDSDFSVKKISFYAAMPQTSECKKSARITNRIADCSNGEPWKGHAIIRDGLLVNCGDSILQYGHHLSGRWLERSEGHTIISTELDFHRKAWRDGTIQIDPTVIPGRSLCLTGPWSDNYYHWLLQYLPILRIARESIPWDTIDHFLVSGPIRSFKAESLSLVGIPLERVIEINAGLTYLSEELVITPIPCDNRSHAPWVIEFLRSLRYPPMDESSPVFLDRPFPASRRIINADEVYSILNSYGIRCIDCSQYSFSDQIRFASSTDFLLGIHGASLANSVFCTPGTTLLELVPRNYTPPYFKELANACGLRYNRIVGIEPGLFPSLFPLKNADIIVPIDPLRKTLNRLCTH